MTKTQGAKGDPGDMAYELSRIDSLSDVNVKIPHDSEDKQETAIVSCSLKKGTDSGDQRTISSQ